MNEFDWQNKDKTIAFEVGRQLKKTDSISWILVALIVFVFNIISIGRITIVGQFLDDVIYTLPFGWYKYFMYFVTFLIVISIYFGIKFKLKKRFLGMIITSSIFLCWVISSILVIVAWSSPNPDFTIEKVWDNTIFVDVMDQYFKNWKNHSIFSGEPLRFLFSDPKSYFTMYAGGGIVGNFLAGLSSYISIFAGFILALFVGFINGMWIFTGDPFYLFKKVDNRRGKGLRILSLSSDVKKPNNENKKGHFKFFRTINTEASELSASSIVQNVNESDITIELPSFNAAVVAPTPSTPAPAPANNNVNYNDDFNFPNYEPIKSATNFKNSASNYGNDNVPIYKNTIDKENTFDNIPLYQNDYQQNFDSFSNANHQPQEQPYYGNGSAQPLADRFNRENSSQNEYIKKTSSYLHEPKQQDIFATPEPKIPLYVNPYAQGPTIDNSVYYPQKEKYIKPTPNYIDSIEEDKSFVSNRMSRELFEKEAALTPFGANGNTQEVVAAVRNLANVAPHQITVDEFITDEQLENQRREEIRLERRKERSPIYDIASNSLTKVLNPLERRESHIQMEIDKTLAKPKINYVDPNYVIPPVTLLNKREINLDDIRRNEIAIREMVNAIDKTFNEFKINAKVINWIIGPSVTKFEIAPAAGTKVSSIISLEHDLKLALATNKLRIEAPIQGKTLVGIEIANKIATPVGLREVIEKAPIQKINSKLLFTIGKDVTGELLYAELDRLPHLLIAGSTGSGKSVMVNALITSILLRAKPNEVKFLMIDPKKVELAIYGPIPHLLTPVISDMKQATIALKAVVNEMDRRYSLFITAAVRNIEDYNRKQTDETLKLPFLVIVIDELADLMMTANKKEIEESIMRLTQMARAAGIHLIVATQRPSTDVITGVIKTNIPSRISFSVSSGIDSRTILDSIGAEKLIGRGDLLYSAMGSNDLIRAQGAYVTDEEIQKVVDYCSANANQTFDDDFLSIRSVNNVRNAEAYDEMYDVIKDYIIREQKASTSLIQRKFSIGYNRAAKIIDQLEADGIIGPPNGSKSRDVNISYN